MYNIAKLNVSLLSVAGVSACLASTAEFNDWENAFHGQRVRTIQFTREENRLEDLGKYLHHKKNQILDLEDMKIQINRYFRDHNIQNNVGSIQEKIEQLANDYYNLLLNRRIIYEEPQAQPVNIAETNHVIQAPPADVEERQAQVLIPVVHPQAIDVPENDRVIEEHFADVEERQEPVTATVVDYHDDAAEPSDPQQRGIDTTISESVEPITPIEVHPKLERIYLDLEQDPETIVVSALASYFHVVMAGEKGTSHTSGHVEGWPTFFESTWNSINKADPQFHPLRLSMHQEPLDNHNKNNFHFTASQKYYEGLGIATHSKAQTSYMPITAPVLAVRESPKFSYEGIPLSPFYQIKLSDSHNLSANNSIIINIIDKLIGYISSILSILLESSNAKHHNEEA